MIFRITTLFYFLLTFSLNGQVIDFENLGLGQDTFLNGSDAQGGFQVDDLFFQNSYNAQWNSWSGWAMTTMRDTTTRGFTNQFSAITGAGYDGSQTYAVGYEFSPVRININTGQGPDSLLGMYVTNATYAFWSMTEGDNVAKAFGGTSGDDPDYFYINVNKYLNGEWVEDSITFYLADYRFDNNEEDYIIDEWTWVDLSSLGMADSIDITFGSSDVGQFGINTPVYVCVDNVTTANGTMTFEPTSYQSFEVLPNPAKNVITLEEDLDGSYYILSSSGKIVQSGIFDREIDISNLPSSVYQLILEAENQNFLSRFVKL